MTALNDSLNEAPMTSHRDTLLEVKEALEACGEQLALLAKDPANNPCVKQAKQALAKLDTLLEAPPADMVEGVQKAILDVWARRPKWERLGPLTRRQAEAAIAALEPARGGDEKQLHIITKTGCSICGDVFHCSAFRAMKDKHNPAPHPYHASPNYPGYEERINEEGHLETRPTVRRASPPKFRDNNATGNGDTAACGESDRSALRSDEAAVEGVDEALLIGMFQAARPDVRAHVIADFVRGTAKNLDYLTCDMAEFRRMVAYLRQPVDIEAGARAIDPSAFGLGLVNNVSLTMQHIARSHAKACATAWGLTYVD